MIHYINRGYVLLLIILLSACKVSKDIATPKVELPVTFRNDTSNDSTGIGDMAWYDLITDATLQQLIDTALVKNYDLLIAEQNINAAQLVLKQSKWGYVPDIRLQVNAGSTRPSDNSLNGLSASQFLGTTHIEDFTA